MAMALGPGDGSYKILKKFFNSNLPVVICTHPSQPGYWLANYWSRKSRISNTKKGRTIR
jgi:UDP-2,3-diacylglucosamine hydrolase